MWDARNSKVAVEEGSDAEGEIGWGDVNVGDLGGAVQELFVKDLMEG